ncbi:Major Facilitator Superfamily protein [Fictibacillus solisalsi]|uniref:Major Facilitator Superfamily protein n=1 Tax=Fictibacillus solisalsi TaxID=459525 RepID=A0A1G9TME1_9BACL|nr:MFS transporter [Fictibacillus solisalsi]SDM48840.1 Major Facilitator Superfamily protein [Fictibacillus solisalsi]
MSRIPFLSFWTAQTSISLADAVYIMVITTFIFQMTGSPLLSSLFPLFQAVSRLSGGFTSPLLLQRFPFNKLLLILEGCKAVLVVVLLAGFDFITGHLPVLFAFILLISCTEGWADPLLSSVIPKIMETEKLVKANSALAITNQAVQIAGYTFTGYAVIRLGHQPVLIVTVILMVLAVCCLLICSRYLPEVEGRAPATKAKWNTIKEGWVLLWRVPTLRTVTLMDAIEGMAGSIWIGALTLVYVKEVLHEGEQWWGFINASYYAGTIIGGLCTLWLANKIQKHLIVSMAAGSFFFSLFTLLYGLTSAPYFALILCVAMGPVYQIRDVAQQTAFQSNIGSEHLPKVYASRGTLLSIISSLSIFLMGLVAEHLGIRAVYILGAVLIMGSALLSFSLLQVNKRERTEVSRTL